MDPLIMVYNGRFSPAFLNLASVVSVCMHKIRQSAHKGVCALFDAACRRTRGVAWASELVGMLATPS